MGNCVFLEAWTKKYLPFEVARHHVWVLQNMLGRGVFTAGEVFSGKHTHFDEGAHWTEILELFQLAAFYRFNKRSPSLPFFRHIVVSTEYYSQVPEETGSPSCISWIQCGPACPKTPEMLPRLKALLWQMLHWTCCLPTSVTIKTAR